jgi:type I restriction-modification system DNA methylase subunit
LENPTLENPTLENPTIYKKRITKKEKEKKSNNIYVKNSFINEKILEFIENRKQLKKPMTDLAITKLINKIEKWQNQYKDEEI